MKTSRSPDMRHQQGVATLVVVLILFFVVSLVAAYTNRNLIFEQRTATNQYRSTQALETAEAGLEWAVSMLNMGRVTDTCVGSASASDPPFRERYLSISDSGRIVPVDSAGAEISAACVSNGAGWTCSCPPAGGSVAGVGTLTAPTAPGIWPAFRVRFIRVGGLGASPPPVTPVQPGVIKVEVLACTRVTGYTALDDCLNFNGQGTAGEGRAVVSSLLALAGGASSPPQAALVARDEIDVSGSGFSAYNTLVGGTGITIQSGDAVSGYNQLVGPPGSPGGTATVIANDPALRSGSSSDGMWEVTGTNGITSEDRMFAAVFNARPVAIQQQQAAVDFPASTGSLTISQVAELNPWRPIWVTGDLAVGADIGTASRPVLMVVTGDLTFTSSTAKIYGLVYIRTPSAVNRWVTSGAGQISGAVVADKKVRGSGTTDYVFDPDIINKLRWNTGSFVRVPASWKDFQ